MKYIFAKCILIIVCFQSPVVFAKDLAALDAEAVDSNLPNEIRFSVMGNSADGRGGTVDGVIYFTDNNYFEYMFGSTRHKDADLGDKSSREWMLGIGTSPKKSISGGLQFAFWGLPDVTEVYSLKIPLNFKIPQSGWSILVVPSHAVVTLKNLTIASQTFDSESDDDSLQLGIQYETPKDWIFGISVTGHDYEKDYEDLPPLILQRLNALNSQAMGLAGALVKSRGAVFVTRKFADFDLTVDAFNTEYLLDQSQSKGLGLSLVYYLNNQIKIDGSISRSKTKEGKIALTDEEKSPYTDISLGLTYTFD